MIMAMITGNHHESDALTLYQCRRVVGNFSGLARHLRAPWTSVAGCPARGSLGWDVPPSLVEWDLG